MGYCHVHGQHDHEDGCPSCQDAEDRAAADRAEELEKLDDLLRAQDQAAYAYNNPGDYHCPHCMLRTLLEGASCCPKCQQRIEPAYWEQVRHRENEEQRLKQDEARRAKEAWERDAPARMEAERVREQAQRDAEQAAKDRSIKGRFQLVYFGYVVPLLSLFSSFCTAAFIGHMSLRTVLRGETLFAVLTPGLNLVCIFGAFVENSTQGTRSILIFWISVWSVLGYLAAVKILLRKS